MRSLLDVKCAGLRASIFTVVLLALARGSSGQISQVQWNGAPQLLNPSLSGEVYEYAPSAMVDPTDSTKTDIWTCHNATAGVVSDNIYYSQATSSGITSETQVMGPTTGGWDSLNTCDPSVVASTVSYQGTPYNYVMFYTGNNCGSQDNQIGMAVASTVNGPWTKVGTSPVISYSAPGQCSLSGDWGVGQPSVTSVTGTGDFLVFYTVGTGENSTIAGTQSVSSGCYAYVAEVSYNSSTNAATISWTGQLPTAGLPAGGCGLHNFDVMYDSVSGDFYAVGQDNTTPTYYPQFISDHLNLYTIPGGDVWGLSGSWTNIGSITADYTGFARNHDAGFVRTNYGVMPNASQVTVVATNGCESSTAGATGASTGPCNNNLNDPDAYLWSYRLYSLTGAQSTTPVGSGFTLGSSPNSLTAPSGGTASYNINVYATNGYTNLVNLSVSGLPSGATATFSPASVAPGSASTLTITLPSAVVKLERRSFPSVAPVALGFLMLPLLVRRKRRVGLLLILCMIGSLGGALILTGCSGGTTTQIGNGNSTAQPHNYNLTVTGVSGSLQQTTTLSLTVT
jgi:hypothetical protein